MVSKSSRAQDGLPLSPAASLQGDAAQEADKADDVDVAVSVAEKVRVEVDTARIAREAQRDAQRQVDAAMREAQREIERAQRELIREQARTQRMEVVKSEPVAPKITVENLPRKRRARLQ